VFAYVLVTVSSGSERDFVKRIAQCSEVIEASVVIGENDVVLKIEVDDMDHMDKFLTDKLRITPDVFLTTTMVITKQFKPKPQ
jgi:DNA-binding Lrp family transcriptional regulator